MKEEILLFLLKKELYKKNKMSWKGIKLERKCRSCGRRMKGKFLTDFCRYCRNRAIRERARTDLELQDLET